MAHVSTSGQTFVTRDALYLYVTEPLNITILEVETLDWNTKKAQKKALAYLA